MIATTKGEPRERLASIPQMLCKKEVMEILGIVSKHTLRHMVARGQFPEPIRVNSRFHRWRREDVQRWYESNASQPDPQTDPSSK